MTPKKAAAMSFETLTAADLGYLGHAGPMSDNQRLGNFICRSINELNPVLTFFSNFD